jgi:homoserine O-acetyltransferase/O-succinyltransferase
MQSNLLMATLWLFVFALNVGAQQPVPVEKDFVIKDFRFQNGTSLPEVRLHYRTIGTPERDASGQIRNAVLLLHGSSGDATQLLATSFSGALFTPGQPLDATKYFLILPDIIGNGKSTKPSDGLHARFPKYGYTDMVELEHRLVTEELGIRHLRLVMGVSMGGMHTWMWGYKYPGMMDALVPIAAQPGPVEGRNLLWRRILSQAIRTDPEWKNGDYTQQPRGFLSIMPMFDMLIQSPVRLNETLTDYEKTDAYLQQVTEKSRNVDDANNILFRFEASFDYNPIPHLESIQAPLLAIVFPDDELNPPELNVMEKWMPHVKKGSTAYVPVNASSQGHRTQVQAGLWRTRLSDFLNSLPPIK